MAGRHAERIMKAANEDVEAEVFRGQESQKVNNLLVHEQSFKEIC
jgi:hypothetical protein